jgi:hypothetical protein
LYPIILVLGPSGVGKSTVSRWIKKEFQFLHLDIDKPRGFARNGLPADWDECISRIDFARLATFVLQRVDSKKRAGAVLSFPTEHVLTREQIDAASGVGITTVVLWGTEERCIQARSERSRKKGIAFGLARYRRKNGPSFETYKRSEYDDFKFEAFRPDGSRWPRDHVMEVIRRLVAC